MECEASSGGNGDRKVGKGEECDSEDLSIHIGCSCIPLIAECCLVFVVPMCDWPMKCGVEFVCTCIRVAELVLGGIVAFQLAVRHLMGVA